MKEASFLQERFRKPKIEKLGVHNFLMELGTGYAFVGREYRL